MMNDKPLTRIKKNEVQTIWTQFMQSPRNKEFSDVDEIVCGYHFRHQFINEILKNRDIQAMNAETPALIVSQTGTGKSTFVLEKLLLEAKRLGGKLLILASRTALALQYKKEAAKIEAPDLLDELTSKGWAKRRCIGDVEIWTYQAVKELLNDDKLKAENFCIVVFDECHHFVQDAAFDKFTWETYSLLIQNFHHCRRIYLTATPEMVADEIIKMEIRHAGRYANPHSLISSPYIPKFKFYIYEFEADYAYLCPNFFTEDKDIVDLIKNHTGDEKVLVCVDSKERGKKLLEEFGEEIAEYIDADLKNNEKAETVSEIIAEEKFDKKVLIATSFLDVGVNLKDVKLKKIVIYSTSKTHFIQAIGRKRKCRDETVDLYIKIPEIDELKKLSSNLSAKHKMMVKNVKEYIGEDKNFIDDLPFPLYIKRINGKVAFQYNGFSLINVNFRCEEMKQFIGYAEQAESPQEGIAKVFLQWLGLEDNSDSLCWLGKSPGEQFAPLTELMMQYENVIMDKDKWEKFRDEFLNIFNQIADKKRRDDRIPGIGVINKILKQYNLPYEVKNTHENPSRYKIERR